MSCKPTQRKARLVELEQRPVRFERWCLGCGEEMEREAFFCSAECREKHYQKGGRNG